jgi:hypothetical protein
VNANFEPVMSALFAHLAAAATIPFTATATQNSAALASVSTTAGLFAGLPVFGPGVARGATIESVSAGAVTLSDPLGAGGSGVSFTTGFLTTGRRAKFWSQVDAQPALFLRRVGATDDYDHDSFFSRTTLECEAWIYANAGKNPDATPDTALANLEQLVRQSLAGDGDYGDPKFTIGGLVYWCRIEGRTESSPGDLNGQAICKMPIRITLP